MKKIAVFVEGQSELIATRHFLIHYFESKIAFTCLSLYKRRLYESCPYQYENPESDFHYYIYNVGNDNSVLEEVLFHEEKLWAQGFEKIVALRDMYSSNYKKESIHVNSAVSEKFVLGHQETIKKNAKKPDQIFFRFSIMEMEAWVLGMYEVFARLDPTLTPEHIHAQLGYNLPEIDPETYFFKPAVNLGDIFKLVGKKYDKKRGDIEAIYNLSGKDDFSRLYGSAVCASYNLFVDALVGMPTAFS